MLKEIINYYIDEMKDSTLYRSLAEIERKKSVQEELLKLSSMEKEHADFWKDFLKCRGIKVKEFRPSLTTGLYKVMRKIFGLAFTSKVMEMGEAKTIKEYYEFYCKADLSEEEKEKLKQIIEDELMHEDIFHKMSSSEKIEHIRDVFLGMNDGLVEILATVAGLTGAYSGNPYIVGVIGSIVGISGMLSMAIGTYISVKNQRQVKEQKIFENKVLHELLKQKTGIEETLEDPLKAAYYTGLFYLLGTILIVFPFFLGLNSMYALLTSASAAIIAWTISGFIVALTSGLSATRKILEMLVTGLGAATITYTIGSLISSLLGISIL